MTFFGKFFGVPRVVCQNPLSPLYQYQRCQPDCAWTKARNLRDMKRRQMAIDYAADRARLMCLKKATILPPELREKASEEFVERIPIRTAIGQHRSRCVVTGRGKGVVLRWRISRFIFRHLVDYNKMSGVQRAIW